MLEKYLMLEKYYVRCQKGGVGWPIDSIQNGYYSKTPLFRSPLSSNSRFIRIYCAFLNGLKLLNLIPSNSRSP